MKKVNMTKLRTVLFLAVLFACLTLNLSSCGECNHEFGQWEVKREATCQKEGKKVRECEKCGEVEEKKTEKTEHTKVIDAAVAPTCTEPGKSEGSHCSVCNTVIAEQKTVEAKGHTEKVLSAVAATCTADGKSEGKECSVCHEVLLQQQAITAKGHDYQYKVTREASCIENGEKKVTCSRCEYSATETFSLPIYTSTVLYDQALGYTGEVTTYKKDGSGLALGTCFVISSDGKIVTNYHVIEGAYSAKVSLGGKSYTVSSVLAYDKNIDLAVIKISASDLPYATVCKKDVPVGSQVYAMGSPRGLTATFSQGMVTSKRTMDGVSYVQHDASITHGNSGGPLINIYGEVVGINTWGIADSQNLNFAVFTSELDNLKYGTPLTMAQFYEKECNPRQMLINYVCENYDRKDGSDYYVMYNHSDGTVYLISYDTAEDFLSITLMYEWSDGDDIILMMVVQENAALEYYAKYTFKSGNTFEMLGEITASTFKRTSTLSYYSYNGSSSLISSAREVFTDFFVDMLDWYSAYNTAYGVGVSLADLGFTSFG